jgi:gluconolactonase
MTILRSIALALAVAALACSNKAGTSPSASNASGAGAGSRAGAGQPASGASAGQNAGGAATAGSVGATAGVPSGASTAGATSGTSAASTGASGTGSGSDAGSGTTTTGSGLDGGQPEGGVGTAARFVCPAGPFPAPVAGPPQNVCTTFPYKYNWNEGPTWITSQQAFFFSNFVHGAAGPGDIIKYTPGGDCESWVSGAAVAGTANFSVGCNGLTATYDGRLVGVCQGGRAVEAYDMTTKQMTILASMYMGKLLDSPNDVAAHSNGSIYFSNPTYELGGRPQGFGPAVFYIDPTGVLNLIQTVNNAQPNGIAISPDEKTLYVEIDGSGVKTYDLDVNGVPSNGPKNFTHTTDGMSVDCAGDLYLSNGDIIGPTGTRVGTFPGGTMAAFGGADGKTLIVVGSGVGLYTLQMNVPGAPH